MYISLNDTKIIKCKMNTFMKYNGFRDIISMFILGVFDVES